MNVVKLSGDMPSEEQADFLQAFSWRLRHILRGFSMSRAYVERALSFNESLAAIEKSFGPRRRRKRRRVRLHPEIELVINMKAWELALARDPKAELFDGPDVRAAVLEIKQKLNPRRGRTPDGLLRNAVHALMALHHETFSTQLRANATRNGEYDPHIVSPSGQYYLSELQKIDPDITLVQFVNIVVAARASGEIEGKSVGAFMPSIDWKSDPATGQAVSARADERIKIMPLMPIYSS